MLNTLAQIHPPPDGALNASSHGPLQGKENPYFPGRLLTDINLNCKVRFVDPPRRAIACRHLAQDWISKFIESAGHKPSYEQFAAPDVLRRRLRDDNDARYLATPRIASWRIVRYDDWGRVFFDHLRMLSVPAGRGAVAIELRMLDHVTAVGLKVKDTEAGRVFVIKHYDPDKTAAHRRARFVSLEHVKRLSARDFFNDLWEDKGHDSTMMVTVGSKELAALADLDARFMHVPCTVAGKLPALSTSTLRYLVSGNAVEGLSRVTDTFRRLENAERLRMLAPAGAPPLFYTLMLHGVHQMIPVFGALIEALPVADRAFLLAARHPDGLPAFRAALCSGRIEMIDPFFSLVRRCLPPELHEPVLLAARPGGHAALFELCNAGYTESFRAYVRALADLDVDLRIRLLTAGRPTPQGMQCPLTAAVMRAHVDIIDAFGFALSSLPDEARIALLSPWKTFRQHRTATYRAGVSALETLVRTFAPTLL